MFFGCFFFKTNLHFAAAVKLFFFHFPVRRTGYNTQEVWALQRRLLTPSHSHLWFPAGSRGGHSGGGGRGMSCSIQPWRGGGGGGVLGGAIKHIFHRLYMMQGRDKFCKQRRKSFWVFLQGIFCLPLGFPHRCLQRQVSHNHYLAARFYVW